MNRTRCDFCGAWIERWPETACWPRCGGMACAECDAKIRTIDTDDAPNRIRRSFVAMQMTIARGAK